MEKFTQLLQPVADNLYISALVALIPIIFWNVLQFIYETVISYYF